MSNEMKMNELDKVVGACAWIRGVGYAQCDHYKSKADGTQHYGMRDCNYQGYFNPNWGKLTGRVSGEASGNKRLGARTSVS